MQEKWRYVHIFLAGVFIYCNYVIIHIKFKEYNNEEKKPEYKLNENKVPSQIDNKTTNTATKFQNVETPCCNPLECEVGGYWSLKNDMSFKKLSRVLDTNMQLRMRKGWPTNLYHGDLRCGKKYPLPRLIRFNNTESYYLDIASQCDSLSNAPCCRDDVGWCGRGDWFCNCDSCLNYDKIIHAELYDWKATSCGIYETPYSEQCKFLSRKFTSISFIGDSLIRHTFSALLLYLTDDPEYGALKHSLNQKSKDYCKSENQFVDSACHIKLATDWEQILANEKYCLNVKEKIKVSFTQAFGTSRSLLAIEKVKEVLKEPRPLIIMGIGVHDNFNANKVIDSYFQPIVDLKEHSENTSPVIIWFNTHAAGPLKPLSFQDTQGNSNIIKFNSLMREYCRKHKIFVFDSYNLTKGVHSFDGTHYGSSLNKLKVTLLLHGLHFL